MDAKTRRIAVKQRALQLGFCDVGVTDLGPNSHGTVLAKWLSAGMAGTMSYMHRQESRRLEPRRIVPGTTRAIMVLRNYYNPDPQRRPGTGLIAKYARGTDYHETLSIPMRKLADYVKSIGDSDTIARTYVDAGPVPERELAQRAGLGWIGRNTMLIHPEFGSHLFIGAVLTNLDLALDEPFEADRCGSCARCVDACPSGAIRGDRLLDSRLCISYLTIEHRGEIAGNLHRCIGDRVFGCDDCQEVCPWNRKRARCADDTYLSLCSTRAEVLLEEFLSMDCDEFRRLYAGTPLERTGFDRLRRNALIARTNSTGRCGPTE